MMIQRTLSPEWYYIFVGLVSILSVARVTRFLVADKFPPLKRLRDAYEERTDGTGWDLLTMCNYCMAVWVAPVVLIWGLLAGVYDPNGLNAYSLSARIWWIANGMAALMYVAAIVVTFDGDKSED